jgi:hypothetical protein
MTARETVKRVVAKVLSWPPRHERKAAIEAARTARDAARRKAEQAATVRREIRRIAYDDNHFAERIAGEIIRGYGRGRA